MIVSLFNLSNYNNKSDTKIYSLTKGQIIIFINNSNHKYHLLSW